MREKWNSFEIETSSASYTFIASSLFNVKCDTRVQLDRISMSSKIEVQTHHKIMVLRMGMEYAVKSIEAILKRSERFMQFSL